jgi:hypothetical protein
MSIRKLKRRAMARLGEPRVSLRLPSEFTGYLGMTSIERENSLRACLAEYVEYHRRMRGKV